MYCTIWLQPIKFIYWTQDFVSAEKRTKFYSRLPFLKSLNFFAGRSPLALVKTLDTASKLQVSRNAFWLLGLKDDFYTMQQIKRTACERDEIPIIVFFMHPSQGLALDKQAGHYMPDHRIGESQNYLEASHAIRLEVEQDVYKM